MDRPLVVVHLYPAGVPNVIEAPFGFDPLELLDLAERLEAAPRTLIVSSGYDLEFCVHRPTPEPEPVRSNGGGGYG